MRVALIRDNRVAGVILSNLAFAQTLGADAVVDVTDLPRVQPGDAYVDGVFTPGPVDNTAINKQGLEARAEHALDELRAFRALASPSQAQSVATIKLLCLVCIGLIRLALNKLDSQE